ncbi:3-oxo-5a-steroid 4- dehydrogenase [Hypoxylon texense]
MAFDLSLLEILILTSALLLIGRAATAMLQHLDQYVTSDIPVNEIVPMTPYDSVMTKLLYAVAMIQGIKLVFAVAVSLMIPMAAFFIFVV